MRAHDWTILALWCLCYANAQNYHNAVENSVFRDEQFLEMSGRALFLRCHAQFAQLRWIQCEVPSTNSHQQKSSLEFAH